MVHEMITSKENRAVKALKKYLTQPHRSDERMVIEGIHAAQVFLAQGGKPLLTWVGQSGQNLPEIQALLQMIQSPILYLSDSVFRGLSILSQGVSILIEVERPNQCVMNTTIITKNVVLLDGIQDAGNMGSILRSAAAAGIRDVVLNYRCVNPFSPKVLRSAVGAHFSLNIVEVELLNDTIDLLKKQGLSILVASSHASDPVYDANLTSPVAWLLGNEGAGVSDELMGLADRQVNIPMVVGESLNVAAAAAICFFETSRQSRSNYKQ